jgi:MoaA/NifB/PqqE/SkfB family radical SAM enzyme
MAAVSLIDRVRYAPLHAQLVVTRRCNLSCGYCSEYDDHSDPVAYELLRERIDKLAELGTLSLELTGGEPLMQPRLFDLIAYATQHRHRFFQRKMITNAYLLNADKVKRLNDAGLTHMQISLDGVQTNDVTVKVLRPLRPKLAAVAAHARFKVTLSAVIGAAPSDEVVEIVDFAEQHGFRPRVLLLHDADGQIRLTSDQLALFRNVQQRLGQRFEEAHDYRGRLMNGRPAPFRCRAGARYLYVDELGDVVWCSQTRNLFRKALLQYGPADLAEQFHTRKPCSETCTVGCVRNDSKLDEWRSQDLPYRAPTRLPVIQPGSAGPRPA